jgi:hypothetical protein
MTSSRWVSTASCDGSLAAARVPPRVRKPGSQTYIRATRRSEIGRRRDQEPAFQELELSIPSSRQPAATTLSHTGRRKLRADAAAATRPGNRTRDRMSDRVGECDALIRYVGAEVPETIAQRGAVTASAGARHRERDVLKIYLLRVVVECGDDVTGDRTVDRIPSDATLRIAYRAALTKPQRHGGRQAQVDVVRRRARRARIHNRRNDRLALPIDLNTHPTVGALSEGP